MTTNINKTKKPIDLTKRSFPEIRKEMVSYVKRYYPNTYKDFNDSSFGALMLDLVSYVGDQLHYYVDHNANEAHPFFAKQQENVVAWAISNNFPLVSSGTTTEEIDIFLPVPASPNTIGIDPNYSEILLRVGSRYGSQGGSIYTQTEDVVVNQKNSVIIGKQTSEDGSQLTYFTMKTKVPVVSGIETMFSVDVGSFKRFLTIEIPDPTITEILSVTDTEGNEYFEVESLSQDVIYKSIYDPGSNSSVDSSIKGSVMKPVPVPRRFIKQTGMNLTKIVFGHGSDNDLTTNDIMDPSRRFGITGKGTVSVPKLDPLRLLSTNKLGIAPENTTLTIRYRSNTNINSNAAVGAVSQILDVTMDFKNEHLLDSVKTDYIRRNIEVYNSRPINGHISFPNTEEIKKRYFGSPTYQGRAVTSQDYVSAVYSMPSKFGSIKRASILRDNNDLRRNLNIYLIAEGANSFLEAPSKLLKENVRTWLDSVRMLSDSIDLFDAYVINLKVDFLVKAKTNINPATLLANLKSQLYSELTTIPPDIGEPFYISEVHKILKNHPDVLDVPIDSISIESITGTAYTDYSYDIKANKSPKGTGSYIYIPENSIWEIRYLDDISGTILI